MSGGKCRNAREQARNLLLQSKHCQKSLWLYVTIDAIAKPYVTKSLVKQREIVGSLVTYCRAMQQRHQFYFLTLYTEHIKVGGYTSEIYITEYCNSVLSLSALLDNYTDDDALAWLYVTTFSSISLFSLNVSSHQSFALVTYSGLRQNFS